MTPRCRTQETVGFQRANRNGEDVALMKSVLVAGLYPNVVRVDPPSKPQMPPFLRILGEEGYEELVQLHPSSVNAERKLFKTRWLAYHEKVKTSNVFLRDCTPVTPYQLLLFGGQLNVNHAAGTITLDEWASFGAPARVRSLMCLSCSE